MCNPPSRHKTCVYIYNGPHVFSKVLLRCLHTSYYNIILECLLYSPSLMWSFMLLIQVPHRTKFWGNSSSESEALKRRDTFCVCPIMLHGLGFNPCFPTQERWFNPRTWVEWTLTSTVLSKFPYSPTQLLTFNEVNFFLSKLLHEGGIYTFARAIMNYKTHKLNVDYHFLNINIFFKINLKIIYMELYVHD